MDSKPNRNVQRLTLHVAVGTLAAALSSIFGGDFGTLAWVRYPFAANRSAASGYPLATITFTHIRPDVSQVFAKATFVPIAIVRARIILNLQNLAALKDTLNAFIQTASTSETPAPATGGATKH
jgi:hypothetical protein